MSKTETFIKKDGISFSWNLFDTILHSQSNKSKIVPSFFNMKEIYLEVWEDGHKHYIQVDVSTGMIAIHEREVIITHDSDGNRVYGSSLADISTTAINALLKYKTYQELLLAFFAEKKKINHQKVDDEFLLYEESVKFLTKEV